MAGLGSYPSGTPLSRVPSLLLLGGYLVASVLIFLGDWRSLSIQVVVISVLLPLWAGGLGDLFISLGRIRWLFILVFITKFSEILFFPPGEISTVWPRILSESGLITTRLVVSLALVYIFTFNVSHREIRQSLSLVLGLFSPHRAQFFSLASMILFSALPHLLSSGKELSRALRLRGIRPGRRPLLVARVTSLGMLRESAVWSTEVSQALTLRGAERLKIPSNLAVEESLQPTPFVYGIGFLVIFFLFSLGYWIL
ncbi:MAG: hypothetical protein GW949_01875 [Spirochaetales bacterium]|nr:hypothetical protein [Spirochaetales bacterium]